MYTSDLLLCGGTCINCRANCLVVEGLLCAEKSRIVNQSSALHTCYVTLRYIILYYLLIPSLISDFVTLHDQGLVTTRSEYHVTCQDTKPNDSLWAYLSRSFVCFSLFNYDVYARSIHSPVRKDWSNGETITHFNVLAWRTWLSGYFQIDDFLFSFPLYVHLPFIITLPSQWTQSFIIVFNPLLLPRPLDPILTKLNPFHTFMSYSLLLLLLHIFQLSRIRFPGLFQFGMNVWNCT